MASNVSPNVGRETVPAIIPTRIRRILFSIWSSAFYYPSASRPPEEGAHVSPGESDLRESLTICDHGDRPSGAKAPTLQDVKKHRRAEIAVIVRVIAVAGECPNDPTPYNRSMVRLVQSLEETFGAAR
jgi:hypothetical protein